MANSHFITILRLKFSYIFYLGFLHMTFIKKVYTKNFLRAHI